MKKASEYEDRMDKIFAHGQLWKHRTLRTIFDPGSSEWDNTTMDQKIEITKKIVCSGEDLYDLIFDYKDRYLEQDRRDISGRVTESVILLLSYNLKSTGD